MSCYGIIGAMEEEVSILKDKMKLNNIVKIASMEFCEGELSNKQVVIVRSGIGKVNAAICTQILIDKFHVTEILNTGVAGSLRNEINIGDIVISSDAMQHDVDARGFGYPLGEIPRMETSVFPAELALVHIAKEVCQIVNPEIQTFVGRVVSGDQFISDPDRKKVIIDNFQAYCTEMEGAAIAQTAYLNQIPYLVIRAISDKADDSAHMDYGEFERQAIKHTVNLVTTLLEKI
ncbi:5'-methylthioadenosine/adenosylhomocysteine nucleosidase [Anaeromicropila populeti]|uniref:adenosylhomocysteine nucleosidase n=1 Tax=Anaeromicropila populeti TaxID=37658 RepID=A0A1I6LS91_9FIRM|nr:5'-methylthioadenosine/adenosylhomocysteine nucleosidase [Anaeromicropila populeti]SFS06355.1 adenosylhomocysteine nucleosidase [Anaeromicropila populeti]